jgi:hypothetical protein
MFVISHRFREGQQISALSSSIGLPKSAGENGFSQNHIGRRMGPMNQSVDAAIRINATKERA